MVEQYSKAYAAACFPVGVTDNSESKSIKRDYLYMKNIRVLHY